MTGPAPGPNLSAMAAPDETEPTLSKSALLEALRSSRDEIVTLVRSLPPERLEEGRYENGWNGRQILAHIASIEWSYPRLIDIARDAGSPPPHAAQTDTPTRSMRGGNDAYNDRQVAKRASVSVPDARTLMIQP